MEGTFFPAGGALKPAGTAGQGPLPGGPAAPLIPARLPQPQTKGHWALHRSAFWSFPPGPAGSSGWPCLELLSAALGLGFNRIALEETIPGGVAVTPGTGIWEARQPREGRGLSLGCGSGTRPGLRPGPWRLRRACVDHTRAKARTTAWWAAPHARSQHREGTHWPAMSRVLAGG